MDHMKYPSVPQLTKVTRIERIHVEMDDQRASDKGKTTAPNLGLRCESAENGQLIPKTNLETCRERMIRRSPQVSSLRDFAPSAAFSSRRHSHGDGSGLFPFVPKLNSRVMEKLTPHRIQRWSHSFLDLLKDHVGIQMFLVFLEKEFSAENLRFWLACQELKQTLRVNVPKLVSKIFSDFLHEESPTSINVDSKIYNHVKINLSNPSYNTFDEAQEHIFELMKTDSYPRFIRSERYKQLVKDSSGKSRKK